MNKAMKRINIPKRLQVEVFTRDNWHCRYCGDAVFFSPSLKILDDLSSGHGYYHRNGKAGEMLSLFQWKWASVDHVLPVNKGGENNYENLVTACWECNLKLRDNTVDKPNPKPVIDNPTGWDGFYSLFLKFRKI